MISELIPIYIISLADEKLRKDALKKQFPAYYNQFKFIDAFDFRNKNIEDIGHLYNRCTHNEKNPLTSTEIGCSLSHIEALNLFLESKHKRCLILEDDIIGTDKDIDLSLQLLRNNFNNGLYILGGQEGMKNGKYLCGYMNLTNIYTVPYLARFFLYRTCCYSVDRWWAKQIIIRQNTCLRRADDWTQLTKFRKDVFFFKVLKHPLTLENSYIQHERNLSKDNLASLVYRNFLKLYLSSLILFRQLKKIK